MMQYSASVAVVKSKSKNKLSQHLKRPFTLILCEEDQQHFEATFHKNSIIKLLIFEIMINMSIFLSVQTISTKKCKSPNIKTNSSYFTLVPSNLQLYSLSVYFELFLLFFVCLLILYLLFMSLSLSTYALTKKLTDASLLTELYQSVNYY